MSDINHDIVDELRGFAAGSESARASLMRDAADEIERLRDWLEMASAVIHYSAIAEVQALLSEESDEKGES